MNTFEQTLAQADILHRFCTEAASAKDAEELANVLERAYEADGLYVFGEFFDIKRVKEIFETNSGLKIKLQLFAYGYYKHAQQAVKQGATPLTEKQVAKLRELTLATLVHGTHSRIVAYDVIKKELDITDVRKIEDIIIDAIYHNVVSGKLDQENESFIIEKFIARDVNPKRLPQISADLQAWKQKCGQLIDFTDTVVKDTPNTQAVPMEVSSPATAPAAAAAAAETAMN